MSPLNEVTKTSETQRLKEALLQAFSEDELRILGFDLGIDYGALTKESASKEQKIRALVEYVSRRGMLDTLTQYLRTHRPLIDLERETAKYGDLNTPLDTLEALVERETMLRDAEYLRTKLEYQRREVELIGKRLATQRRTSRSMILGVVTASIIAFTFGIVGNVIANAVQSQFAISNSPTLIASLAVATFSILAATLLFNLVQSRRDAQRKELSNQIKLTQKVVSGPERTDETNVKRAVQ